jgi:hypothetical protein
LARAKIYDINFPSLNRPGHRSFATACKEAPITSQTEKPIPLSDRLGPIKGAALAFRIVLFILFRFVWTLSLFPFILKYLLFTLIGRPAELKEFLSDRTIDPDPHMTLHYYTLGFYEPEVLSRVEGEVSRFRRGHSWLREPILLYHHRHRIKGESRLMPVIGLLPIGFDKQVYQDTLRILSCLKEISRSHGIDWRISNLFGLGVSGTIRGGEFGADLDFFLPLVRKTIFWRP